MSTLADRYIRRSLQINRVGVGESIENSKILSEAIDRVNAIVDNVVNGRISRIQAEIQIQEALLDVYNEELIPKIANDTREIIRLETEWIQDTISDFTDTPLIVSDLGVLFDQAQNRDYQGRVFGEWFEREGVRNVTAVNQVLRTAFIEGIGVAEAQRRVAAVIGNSDKNIRTLTRSNLLHATAEARDDFLRQNEDLIEGTVWNATLDVRTTPHICGIRDQLRYDLNKQPIDHDLPYEDGPGRIHFNCRSIDIPIIPDVSLLTAQRPAINAGKEYQRGDKFTNRGTVRRPRRADVDIERFNITQRTNRTRFEGWMRSQPVAFVADSFGSLERARAFKKGASLADVAVDVFNRPMSLSDL